MDSTAEAVYIVTYPIVWLSYDLLKGYTSPKGSAKCYTTLTDSNIKIAAQLWVSDRASASSLYGPVHLWDLSHVTSLANVWCGRDVTNCGSAYVAMRSFDDDISKWDVSEVASMYQSKSIRIFENSLTRRGHAFVIEWMRGVM
jgi:hypothetical protein